MVTYQPSRPETDRSFNILSAIIRSNRFDDVERDIEEFITDLDIFENINKPYITGTLMILDTDNILQEFDYQGGETIEIRIQNMGLEEEESIVEKKFIIDKIIRSRKTNQNADIFQLHLTEFHAFQSSLINVNKSYKGNHNEIIREILEEHLEKELMISNDLFQNNTKLIVPNMHPLESCSWINKYCTNHDGFPFYFYSTFNTNFLYMISLGFMLKNKPQNINKPFIYSQSGQNFSLIKEQKMFGIKSYDHVDNDDIISLIRSGDIGSNYIFMDATSTLKSNFDFNLTRDVLSLLYENYTFKNNNNVNFGAGSKVNDKKLEEYNSNSMLTIGTIGAYQIDQGISYKTLGEESQREDYKKHMISKALKKHIYKNPISIEVEGKHFLNGSDNFTLGQTIRVLFLNSSPTHHSENLTETAVDVKKSGDYIIYATRHMFKEERYDIKLFCVKLTSFSNQNLNSYINEAA